MHSPRLIPRWPIPALVFEHEKLVGKECVTRAEAVIRMLEQRREAARGRAGFSPQAGMGVDCHTTICQPFGPLTHTFV